MSVLSADSEADAMCIIGNKYFTKGEYKLALEYYNKGFQLFPCSVRVLSNRAATYMRMERWGLAQQDVDAVLKIDPSHTKCLHRRAFIYLNLQQPFEAKKMLDSLIQDLIHNRTRDCTADIIKSESLLHDVQIAIREQQGVYDLKTLMLESNHKLEGASKKLPRKHMDYKHPHIEMRHIEGRGNGMISKKDFVASELIMVAKALVFVQSNPLESSSSLSTTRICFTKMLANLIEELTLHPDCGTELFSLSAGSKFPNPVLPKNTSKIDRPRMLAILNSNWFGSGTSITSAIIAGQRHGTESLADKSKEVAGLWLRPSMFNHSCIPNCAYFIIGDFHFIITNRPVSIGEELTIPYCDLRISFADRCKIFKNWNNGDGFDCLCERCSYSRQNSANVAIDIEIERAYLEALILCGQGCPMGYAAEKALPINRRNFIINRLEKVPLIGQGNLSKAYTLEVMSHCCAGRISEALSRSLQILELEVNLFGIGPEITYLLEAYVRVVSFAMELNKMDLAIFTLNSVYTIFCSPPWGKYTSDDLKMFCQRYVKPDQHSILNRMIDGLEVEEEWY